MGVGSVASIGKGPEGTVVNLVPEIKKRDLRKRHRWTTRKDQPDLIAADVWPSVHCAEPEIEALKATLQRSRCRREAKTAIQDTGGKLEMIKFELRWVNEHAQKRLEFEALRTASFQNETL